MLAFPSTGFSETAFVTKKVAHRSMPNNIHSRFDPLPSPKSTTEQVWPGVSRSHATFRFVAKIQFAGLAGDPDTIGYNICWGGPGAFLYTIGNQDRPRKNILFRVFPRPVFWPQVISW